MAKMNITRIPPRYTEEVKKIDQLMLQLDDLSGTGNSTWTSPSSGVQYPAPIGGDAQLLSVLNLAMKDYYLTADDWNNLENKILYNGIVYLGTTTGSSNAYVATNSDITSLFNGLAVSFKANFTSTGACTLNINSLGAKTILTSKSANAPITSGGIYTVRYDGTNFFLQGEGGGSAVKSVQRGTLAIGTTGTSFNIPLSTIDPNKSIVILNFTRKNISSSQFQASTVIPSSLSTNQLTIVRGGSPTSDPNFDTMTASWEIIEYEDALVQRGVTVASGLSQNITISSVNSKYALNIYGSATSNQGNYTGSYYFIGSVSGTTLTVQRADSTMPATFYWEIVSFPN